MSPKRSPSMKPKDVGAGTRQTKLLADEIQKLKTMNEQLIAKVEDKIGQIKSLEDQLARKRDDQPASGEVVMTSLAGQSYSVPSVEEIRRMEADLKRKTDLLCEVKILLKQV